MTVSAAGRLRPKPPARVLRMKIVYGEDGSLNISIISERALESVLPSRRRYLRVYMMK